MRAIVFRETPSQLVGRANVESAGGFALKNVNPGHEDLVGPCGLEPQTWPRLLRPALANADLKESRPVRARTADLHRVKVKRVLLPAYTISQSY